MSLDSVGGLGDNLMDESMSLGNDFDPSAGVDTMGFGL